MTSAEKSILTRVSHDAWTAWCRRNGIVLPYSLPPLYAPVSRHHALDLLAQDATGDSPHRRRFKQNVASLYALGSENAHHELDSVLGDKLDEKGLGRLHQLAKGTCPCCHAARALDDSGSIWHLRHRHSNATLSSFDPKTQVTKIRSTYYLSTLGDPSDRQVDEIMRALADQLAPQNWSRDKDSSFKRSEPIDVEPKRDDAGTHWYDGKLDWKGKLIESFAWDWNPDASMAMDNLLNVDFRVTKRELNLDYSLDESLSSKLWLARQAGGLDIDRGTCKVEVLGRKALKVDPTHPPDVVPIEVARTPEDDDFLASDYYNIVVITTKTERFTPVQFAPSWFSTLINYQTPVLGGIWMSQAVQSGILRAIAATGSGQAVRVPTTDVGPLSIAS